jgi:hypothetical protein
VADEKIFDLRGEPIRLSQARPTSFDDGFLPEINRLRLAESRACSKRMMVLRAFLGPGVAFMLQAPGGRAGRQSPGRQLRYSERAVVSVVAQFSFKSFDKGRLPFRIARPDR